MVHLYPACSLLYMLVSIWITVRDLGGRHSPSSLHLPSILLKCIDEGLYESVVFLPYPISFNKYRTPFLVLFEKSNYKHKNILQVACGMKFLPIFNCSCNHQWTPSPITLNQNREPVIDLKMWGLTLMSMLWENIKTVLVVEILREILN